MGCGGGGGFGGSGVNRFYGAFSDTTTQTASLTTAAYAMKFNTTEIADGVSIVSGSRITVANTGIYNVQFSAQMDKTTGAAAIVDIWLHYTGTNVPRTNTQVTIDGSQAKIVAAWNFLLPIVANDYVELMWRTNDVDARILYQTSSTSPTRPEVPSIILTVQQV
jgi:hypothetical protein